MVIFSQAGSCHCLCYVSFSVGLSLMHAYCSLIRCLYAHAMSARLVDVFLFQVPSLPEIMQPDAFSSISDQIFGWCLCYRRRPPNFLLLSELVHGQVGLLHGFRHVIKTRPLSLFILCVEFCSLGIIFSWFLGRLTIFRRINFLFAPNSFPFLNEADA